MDFHLGADVRQRDGGRLGALHRVAYDPETGQVTAIVVTESHAPGDDVVVPIGAIDYADDDAVQLELDADGFASLREYGNEVNIAPPPTADQVGSDLVKDPVDVPDVPPVGAATGVESIAFTPILEERTNIPAGSEVIDRDTVVYATDGEVGRVHDVLTDDETNRVASVVVREGTIFTHDALIPAGWIASIRPGAVVLTVDSEQIREANKDE